MKFGPTPNCLACDTDCYYATEGHSPECRQRIHTLWQESKGPEPHFSEEQQEAWLDLFYEGYPQGEPPPAVPVADIEEQGDFSEDVVLALILLPTVEETLPTVKRPGVPAPKEKVVYFDMTDYCRDTVRHYCKIVENRVNLKEASIPFPADNVLHDKDNEEKGELAS